MNDVGAAIVDDLDRLATHAACFVPAWHAREARANASEKANVLPADFSGKLIDQGQAA
jgi:hypothetical protein